MTDIERLQAIIAELELQRAWALTRCGAMAAEIATLQKRLEPGASKPTELAKKIIGS